MRMLFASSIRSLCVQTGTGGSALEVYCAVLYKQQMKAPPQSFVTGSRTMLRGALLLSIGARLSASRPRSVTIPRRLRFILTSAAATLPMLILSTSMVGCPLKYGNLRRISMTLSAVRFCN